METYLFKAIDCRSQLAFLIYYQIKTLAHASNIGSVPQWFWRNHLALQGLVKHGCPWSPEAQEQQFANQNKELVIRARSPPINRNAQYSYHSHVSKGIGSQGLRNGRLYGYSSMIIIVKKSNNIAVNDRPTAHTDSLNVIRNICFASSFPILLSGNELR